MKKIVSFTLLGAGSSPTNFGISSYASAKSKLFRRFAGSQTKKAKWLIIGGVVVTVIGLAGLLGNSKAGIEVRHTPL